VCLSTTGRFEGPGAGRIVAGAGGAAAVPARLGHLLAARATSTLLARWVLEADRPSVGDAPRTAAGGDAG
jgi:hypothetical protein